MKTKISAITAALFLMMAGMFLSCDDDSSEENITSSGQEHLLEGAWWIQNSPQPDGAYFDGTGAGYDLSGDYPDNLYVECEDPLTYTYNGMNFSKTEGGSTLRGLFFLNEDSQGGTLYMYGFSFTVEKINSYTVQGSCLD